MREVAVVRADPGPDSPVYQVTVFAGVPATCDVALPNGEPATRSGGTAAGAAAPRPSAANAAEFELVTVRLAPLLLFSVIAPPLIVDAAVVPVIESIFESSVWTLSVRLSWLPVAPEATKVMGVPLTVMLSASPKLAASESVPGLPDNSVAPVIGAGVEAWLLTALPATPIGRWVAMAPKPSAANAAEFVAVRVRPVPLSLCSAITPSVTVDGVEVPVIESILVSIVWTLS